MSGSPSHLRAHQIADRLGISVRTIRRRIADGTLPSIKLGGARLIPAAKLELILSDVNDRTAPSSVVPDDE